MKILRKIRIGFAIFFLALITLLFLDFTGTLHQYFGWIAKIQFLPALLALNVVIVIGLILLTALFGRIYCSIICPLGVFQDMISNISGKLKKNKFSYSKPISWLRYCALALFILAFVAGVGSFVALLEPYSAFGRIVTNLFAPFYQWGNNLLAYCAKKMDSYAFYNVDVWIKSISTFVISIITLVVIIVLSWKNGRVYCNTICPIGTVLGFVSNFSIFKHRINTEKCNNCGICARNCKSSCIDPKTHTIDNSRCVVCFNCIGNCNQGAIRFGGRRQETGDRRLESEKIKNQKSKIENGRREFLITAGLIAVATTLKAKEKYVDSGLALIEDKKIPKRQTKLVPAGAQSVSNFSKRCTGCQLCVSVCPNKVLRPSTDLLTLMQPEIYFERGYCRTECTKCSEVCPTGAIQKITKADKVSTQIGIAKFIEKNCVVARDGVKCSNCARECPVGAIMMVERKTVQGETVQGERPKLPVVKIERCIGCGACEFYCPATPFKAIYVEGHAVHRFI